MHRARADECFINVVGDALCTGSEAARATPKPSAATGQPANRTHKPSEVRPYYANTVKQPPVFLNLPPRSVDSQESNDAKRKNEKQWAEAGDEFGELVKDLPAVVLPPLGPIDHVPLNPDSIGAPFLGAYGTAARNLEAMTGVPVRLQEMFTGRKEGWAPSEGQGSRYSPIAANGTNPALRYVVTYSLIPDSEGGKGGPSLQRCADGAFNGHYQAFALSMKNRGISSIILRPGWEWSLRTWVWGTSNDVALARLYAACFRQFVTTVEQAFPENRFLYDWNVHQDVTPQSMEAGWPGDQYVDIIGVDIYDAYFGKECARYDFPCRWQNRTQLVLDKVTAFARSRNKPISIPEWGVWTTVKAGDARGGGDNPYFVQKICEFAKDPANRVVYYVYFEKVADGDHRLSTHPAALAAFRKHCVGNPGNPHDLR